ncbi:MAG: hypothetical protein V8Q42_06330 [Anaerovoracaceae bacterium]
MGFWQIRIKPRYNTQYAGPDPTGYLLTLEDWDPVGSRFTDAAGCGKAIALVVDAAYIDFAGDEEEYRRFSA